MRKNIKKITVVAIITVSIFTLIGCGQTKEVSNEETKEENIQKQEEKVEETKITKEEKDEFEALFKEYDKIMDNKVILFMLPKDNERYKTLEECKKEKEQADIIKNKLLETCPNSLQDSLKSYFDLTEARFNKLSETFEYSDETSKMLDNMMKSKNEVFKQIRELKPN